MLLVHDAFLATGDMNGLDRAHQITAPACIKSESLQISESVRIERSVSWTMLSDRH